MLARHVEIDLENHKAVDLGLLSKEMGLSQSQSATSVDRPTP